MVVLTVIGLIGLIIFAVFALIWLLVPARRPLASQVAAVGLVVWAIASIIAGFIALF